MQAREVLYHFQQVGTWVNWKRTADVFLHGDPEAEVKGIATAWIPTDDAIREAHGKGLNLFITHEFGFLAGYAGTRKGDELNQKKQELLDKCGIILLRCHDTWDRMPEYGIPDAWASFLGFETESRPVEAFYKICIVDSLPLEQVADRILSKVRPLGQDTVLVMGDGSRRIRRLAVGTGAITHLPTMADLGADAIVASDDGCNFPTRVLWASDSDTPLLLVGHGTAEKPGMQAMARYLSKTFPEIPAGYVDVEIGHSVYQKTPCHDSIE